MYRILQIGLLLLIFSVSCFTQETLSADPADDPQNPKTTTKVDEFGFATDCDLSARIDNLFIQLNNDPAATGYVVFYNGLDTLPSERNGSRTIGRIRRNLTFRRYDESRLVFVNGGFRDGVATELYLVWPGGEIPVPTETVPEPAMPTGTYLWSSAYLWTEEGSDYLGTLVRPDVKEKEEEEARLSALEREIEGSAETDDPTEEHEPVDEVETNEGSEYDDGLTVEQREDLKFRWTDERFAKEIAKLKGSHGVIIFYADDERYDIAKVTEFINAGRDRIAAAANIPARRIKVIFGGYGDDQVEFHIVSKGSKDPFPRSNPRPVEDLAN